MTHRPLALAALLTAALPARAELTLEQIMADPQWIGPAVEQPFWALDGDAVHFQLERRDSDLRDLYVHDLGEGGARPVPDDAREDLDAPNPVYNDDRTRAAFVRNGDVFVRDLRSGALTQITRSEATESAPMFMADGDVAFQLGTDWFVHDREDGVVTAAAMLKAEKDPAAEPEEDYLRDMQLRLMSTLAREKANREAQREQSEALRAADDTRAPAPVYLGDKVQLLATALSPDGRWMLAVTQPRGADEGQQGKMPKYVTESGYNEIEDVRTRVGRKMPIAQTLHLVDLTDGSVHTLPYDPLPDIADDPLADLREAAEKDPLEGNRDLQIMGIDFGDDGRHAAVMLRAIDNKDRWIATVTREGRALQPQHRLTDEAWINWNFNDFGWLPDDETLWYVSEETGFSHLYTKPVDGSARQLTSGEWEASSPQLSADASSFFFVCNRQWPGDYEICRVPVDGGDVREVTALDGVESFALSPSGDRALVAYSGSYLPMQVAVQPLEGGQARRLTDTRTDEFRAIDWQAPQFVRVPSSHGDFEIWSKLYLPENMEPGRRYPIVMFIHGAGYTQNVHQRYPYYFREQMFHNLLTDDGYIVLDMDFRASEGYGRDWRTAIYRQMGHPELEDYLDGIDWLVENHQGDRDHVGVYGGSYGGFMTFMAMLRAPEAFKAGAALRPVTDWAMYNHPYTANILNTPELDPKAYERSSPIEYAENLQGHLLIAHGMLDDNVFYQDSVRIAQRFIELGKENWELAGYPLERHSFVHPEAWLDEYRRIHKLFEATLK